MIGIFVSLIVYGIVAFGCGMVAAVELRKILIGEEAD